MYGCKAGILSGEKVYIMKKLMAICLALLMALSVAAAAGADGWRVAEDNEVTPERLALFNQAMEGLLGVSYEPIAYLGTQAAEEVIHCYLCRATVVYPGAEPTLSLVYISEASEGTASLQRIEELPLGDEQEDDYSALTSLPAEEVTAFAEAVRDAYLREDWAALAPLIRYPITLYPEVVAEDEAAFLAYAEGRTVHPSDRAQMTEETCRHMFVNGEGLCLGSGQVWILDVNYMKEEAPLLKIISVTGLVEGE